jgi:[ribosomal protein S5]-alanine N-acetyltransferase
MKTLSTNRLILRPFLHSDIPELVANLSDLSVSKWLLVLPHPYTVTDAEWWVNHTNTQWEDPNASSASFGIELRETCKIIGGCGITDIRSGAGKIGYWMGGSFQRQGYGYEAISALLEFARQDLGLTDIEADVYEQNMSSRALLAKLGFVESGLPSVSKLCLADGITKRSISYILRMGTPETGNCIH